MRKLISLVLVVGIALAAWVGLHYWYRSTQSSASESAREQFLASFSKPTQNLQSTAVSALTAIEDPGVIAVEHFTDVCGTSDIKGEKEAVVAISGSYTLPSFATNATVLLNGWKVRYLHGDEHLRGVRAVIDNVSLGPGTLNWQAFGYLSDKDFKDGYEFCYNYTVIAWNDSELDIHSDNFVSGYLESSAAETALFGITSYSRVVADNAQRALLPMGFALEWASQTSVFPWACFDCPVDRHLLQIAYDLGQRERYIANNDTYPYGIGDPGLSSDADVVDDGYVSWETFAILKDNDRRHDFWFQDWIQTLGGADIGFIDPPFTVLPREDAGPFHGCIGGLSEITEEYEITNIPFEYAVPMVTGWEIGLGCDDEHVDKLSIRLDEFTYDKPEDAETGTLRYTLTSEGDSFGHYARHKVSVLGIRAAARQVPQQTNVDLEVVSGEFGFCDRNDQGELVVTIRNLGDGDASPFITTVAFSTRGPDTVSSLNTPPLAAGASIELKFEIPAGCFHPDCSFHIQADSTDVLIEPNEGNNSGSGSCLG